MAEEIRIWRVEAQDRLKELERSKLNMEERIEHWLAHDISVLSSNLLVIGRQVQTQYGGWIDLLCIDREGNSVIVELKRDKTPREITAQVLDYASWVRELETQDIIKIAASYLSETLDQAFRKKFGAELPEVLNGRHSMLVVGSVIDDSSDRIIKYLSDGYGVDINAASFGYYGDGNGQEFLARAFLVAPTEIENRAMRASRRDNMSFEQMESIAEQRGVGQIYRTLMTGLSRWFTPNNRKKSVTFSGILDNGSHKAILNLLPDESSAENGLRFQVFIERLASITGEAQESLMSFLPKNREPYAYFVDAPPDLRGWAGYFRDETEAGTFLRELAKSKNLSSLAAVAKSGA